MNCDFSFKHYKEILEIAQKNNYEFINFEEFIERDKNIEKENNRIKILEKLNFLIMLN